MQFKYPRYILFAVTCFLCVTAVFCQPIENHFTHYTARDGMADGGIRSIIQDSSGFLWVGNENGLSRFDGNTFKIYRYNPADTNSLRENRVWQLFSDSKKRLWVLTFHWLYLYHPEGEWFEHFGINSCADDRLVRICNEENNQFIITGNKSLYKFDMCKKKFSVFYHEGIKTAGFSDYINDEKGTEWIGTMNGLIRYDPKTKKSIVVDTAFWKKIQKENIVGDMALLPGGYMLAITYNCGFYIINRETNEIQQFHWDKKDPSGIILSTYILNDTTLLIGTKKGLSVFDLRRKIFTGEIHPDISNPASILENDKNVMGIFCDREGIIWLGGEHLEKYDFKDYRINIMPADAKEHKLKLFDKYHNLYKCANGVFLLGGNTGLGIYDPSGLQVKDISDRIFDEVHNFREDGREHIWCTTMTYGTLRPKLTVFDLKNNHPEHIKQYDIPGNPGIYDLKIDLKGHVLLATGGKGIATFDTASKTFTFFDENSKPPSRLTSSSTTSLCQDHNGCIWIGTRKGLNKIEKDGVTVKQYSQNKTNTMLQPDWYVTDIKEDKHGMIWFTTLEHGIGRIDERTDSVRFFSIAQGLPTCWSKGLCMDDQDNLWALSKLGMVNLNVTTFQNKLYTADEGFPPPDNIAAPDDKCSIHFSKYTKLLYILTPYSIYEIGEKYTGYNNNIPQTTITGFLVFDKEKPVAAGKPVNLKYNENFINIQFACLLFHSNSQIKYAYKMAGIDKDWVYCNYKRNASYTSLPPGRYTFYVKAQSPEGIWNNTPTQLYIWIKPPVWQTWWFYSLETAIVFSIIFWIIRLYTGRKLAKQKNEFEKLTAVSDERTRIAAEMHDELGSGLTSIRMLSEIAAGKMDHETTAKTEIEKIEKSATILSENLREIIWTMNTRFDKLDDFIIYIRSYATEFFDESPVNFHFSAPDIIPEITLNGELRRNLFLGLKEALNNIMKHSRASEASLSINLREFPIMVIEVRDNGIGIDPSQMKKSGNGLNIMNERLRKYDGTLEIVSASGTRLLFVVPVKSLKI